MDEKIKATLTNVDTWKRGLFMTLFSIISGVAKFIVTLVAVFQFITLLFKGETNDAMKPFGQNLSTYLYQITLFLTFKTDEMPFPFVAFPDGTPESTPYSTTDSTPYKDSEEDIKEDTTGNTKDDSLKG
ncbi:MAG: hypothetical protein ACI97K_001246 [Glaciecola sp.]|jgi:hypothetical protein